MWVAQVPFPRTVYNSAEAEHSIILSNADLENLFSLSTVGSFASFQGMDIYGMSDGTGMDFRQVYP